MTAHSEHSPSGPPAKRSCVVVTALGPNPAALIELVWALAEQQGITTDAAHVVAVARTVHYLNEELLAPNGALDQLHAVRGAALLPAQRLVVHEAIAANGSLIEDDDTDLHAEIFSEAVWQAARAAQKEAGDRPVIFALAGGRRRTATALVTTAFQLLARPQDRCIDVRVSHRAVEGGSGFFFPDQPEQDFSDSKGNPFRASDVQVLIPEIPLPRLRALLGNVDFEHFSDALKASQRRIDEAAPPNVCVDFEKLKVFVNEIDVRLTEQRFLVFAAMALARHDGEGWLTSDDARLRQVWKACERKWSKLARSELKQDNPSGVLVWLCGEIGENDTELWKGQPLRKLRSDVRKALATFCAKHRPGWARFLLPEKAKVTDTSKQRLPVETRFIELRNLPEALGR